MQQSGLGDDRCGGLVGTPLHRGSLFDPRHDDISILCRGLSWKDVEDVAGVQTCWSGVWYAPRAKNWIKVNILTYTGPDNALNLVDKTTLVIKSLNVAPP